MRLVSGRVAAPSFAQTESFTGEVWAEPVLVGSEIVSLHEVFFTPGSRTYWHQHHGGQILRITAGEGLVVAEGSPALLVRAGDLVWTEPGERHWHGAGPSTVLAHTAISLGGHTWYEEVAEQAYAAAVAGTAAS